MGLFDNRIAYKPFEYPEYVTQGWLPQNLVHWVHTRISMQRDLKDWNERLTPVERYIVENVLLAFAQTETAVEDYWVNKVYKWFPKYEIKNMAVAFGSMEANHAEAYSYLNETLGLEDFKGFLLDPILAKRFAFLINTKADYTPEELKVNPEARKDIAKSLAIFSAFAEGVALYSSFAVLYSFSRAPRGMLIGMGTQMKYSVKDECYSADTEVLTSDGWVRFDKLTDDKNLAQYNMESKEISFVKPSRLVVKDYEGELINFTGEKYSIDGLVTSEHDMVFKYDYHSSYRKVKAKDLKLSPKARVPVAGYKIMGSRTNMSALEKFRVATQADAFISTRYTGELVGTIPVIFTFSKERKIKRLVDILNQLGYTYTQKLQPLTENQPNKKQQTKFVVNVPVEVNIAKNFDWINLADITNTWVDDFVEELSHWDGSVLKNCSYIYYSSTESVNLDKIQAVCTLGGYFTTRSIQKDDRSETYNDIYRLYIHKTDYKRLGCVSAKNTFYKGKVYCATVPEGTLVTRRNGKPLIAGNCLHSKMGCKLFNHLCEEYSLLRQEVKSEILQAAELVINLEHKFIDKLFAKGDLINLKCKDLKNFITQRANEKLNELGYEGTYFDYDKESADELKWFYMMANGETHTDFFATRPTEYTQIGAEENWEDIF